MVLPKNQCDFALISCRRHLDYKNSQLETVMDLLSLTIGKRQQDRCFDFATVLHGLSYTVYYNRTNQPCVYLNVYTIPNFFSIFLPSFLILDGEIDDVHNNLSIKNASLIAIGITLT